MGKTQDLRPAQDVHAEAIRASEPFVGRWNGLVSTANWEKGRIIYEWRTALIDADAAVSDYADETWSRMVGGVSPQHVGRLRRVYERYHDTYTTYEGLYWSHFHAAMDWQDAEMWLEGAVQNGWSVSKMRRQRWETLGSLTEEQPRDEEIVAGEVDEDFVASPDDQQPTEMELPPVIGEHVETVQDTLGRATHEDAEVTAAADDGASNFDVESQESVASVQPFRDLRELPQDLTEAFDSFKLAILRHKMSDWVEVPRNDVLAAVDALRQLILAPPGDAHSTA